MTEKPKTIVDFISGVDFPEREVHLFWDTATLYEISQLEQRIKASRGEEQDELVALREKLEDKVIENAIKVTVKGTPARLSKDIEKLVDSQIKEKELTGEEADMFRVEETTRIFLKNHMVKVVMGEVEESPVTDETLDYILNELPVTESERLMRAVSEVNHITIVHTLEKQNVNFLSVSSPQKP